MRQTVASQAFPDVPGLWNGGGGEVEGLYVHVPFCFHKCHYCDFYSIVESPTRDQRDAFTDRLVGEWRWYNRNRTRRPRTIFVGGGTPTLLEPKHWRRLLDAFRSLNTLQHVEEFTVEANPETVTPQLISLLGDGGVSRISLGAQSFNTAQLKTLERWHEPSSVTRAVDIVRAAGIDNINLDLIFAIPGQTLGDLDADLDALLALEPTHVSCYSLIFEPNTPLTEKLRQGRIDRMDEDTERAMYERVIDRLTSAGFDHYEISNFARDCARCAHNLLYWQNANWLGIGPSASSHFDGVRWKNVAHLGQYLAADSHAPVTDIEQLTADQSVGEQLMMRLRLLDGVPLDWLDAHLPSADPRRGRIDVFVAQRLLERTATHLRLTCNGLFVADALFAELL